MPTCGVLNGPSGLAVDGVGNVNIADTGNRRILKEMPVAGSPSTGTYSESTLPTTLNLSEPVGVAVDGSGNVYIVDSSNNPVLKETLSRANYTETQVTTTALIEPAAVAVGGNGAVYIADNGVGILLKETPSGGSYIEATAATERTPFRDGGDGAGNIFITSAGFPRLRMESLSGGSYTDTVLNSNIPIEPFGVAVDGAGDVFCVNVFIYRVPMSAPTVLSTFASTEVGSDSSAQTFGIANIGTASLTFATPESGSNPVLDGDFSVTASGGTSCPVVSSSGPSGTLGVGMACVYSVEFTPSTTGNPLSSTLTVIDNSLSAVNSMQSVALSGIGLPGPDVTSTAVTAVPAAIDEGQSSTIVIMVADTTNSSTTPTGAARVQDGATVLATSAPVTNGVYTISDIHRG